MAFWEHSAPRILVIDDNPSIHRDFELVLLDGLPNPELDADEQRLYGRQAPRAVAKPAYVLEHALSGLEGLEKVRQALAEERPFQLAFVDIRMPGIDGVETIERIWQIDPRIQMVICTAFADYSWDELTRRLGQTDKLLVLKKPFDNIEVTQLASTLTEKWFLARQAALKFEQMELLVAERTRKLLALQQRELAPEAGPTLRVAEPPPAETGESADGKELPLVLLVSANADWRTQTGAALGPDYRCVEAGNVEQGWQHAQESVPDLVLGAVGPAQRDSLELCRRLKTAELTSHIPVMLLAGAGLEAAQIEALDAGADDCLPWPANPGLLRSRAESLLRSGRNALERVGPDLALHPRELAANQVDALFLRRMLDTIDKHLPDCEFDVDALAHHLAVSRRQLFRKLRAVTGCTPHAFIRTLRLNRAAQLLQDSQMTVSEITYAVGFADLKHFRNLFKERFGVTPGDYTRRVAGQKAA